MLDLYKDAIESARQVRELSLRQVRPAQPATRSKRIVIADDNHDLVDTLSMVLELDGHKCYGTHDGVGAIRLAKALEPDFLLLDIAMPHINGYDVARQIRARPWGHDMQIVAITGRALPEDRSRAMSAVFDFHLTKPVRLDVLSGILTANAAAAVAAAHL
jgi:CheY-like chemotaxis protein